MSTSPHDILRRHRLTVKDFHRMGEAGILGEDDRVELIEGELVEMTPIGSKHAGTVAQLSRLFERQVGEDALVWVQNPVAMGEDSEPEPDLCLLHPRADYYKSAHPRAEDVLLIVEVADTSLRYDREIKVPLYARHGIAEVWVIDLEGGIAHVFQDPTDKGYQKVSHLMVPARLRPLLLPAAGVDLAALF